MRQVRAVAIWGVVLLVSVTPIIIASMSPLLEWRSAIYTLAGISGVIGLSLLFLQPILAADFLPGLSPLEGRLLHRLSGSALALSVFIHVVGLWITSPPDVIDALLFVSATPFSIWGVVAMWSVFITACLVLVRAKLRASTWSLSHQCLAVVTVVGSVVHALMIEGTMGIMSKSILCALIVLVAATLLFKRYVKKIGKSRRA